MKKKKVLSLLLALCLCAGLFTVPASAGYICVRYPGSMADGRPNIGIKPDQESALFFNENNNTFYSSDYRQEYWPDISHGFEDGWRPLLMGKGLYMDKDFVIHDINQGRYEQTYAFSEGYVCARKPRKTVAEYTTYCYVDKQGNEVFQQPEGCGEISISDTYDSGSTFLGAVKNGRVCVVRNMDTLKRNSDPSRYSNQPLIDVGVSYNSLKNTPSSIQYAYIDTTGALVTDWVTPQSAEEILDLPLYDEDGISFRDAVSFADREAKAISKEEYDELCRAKTQYPEHYVTYPDGTRSGKNGTEFSDTHPNTTYGQAQAQFMGYTIDPENLYSGRGDIVVLLTNNTPNWDEGDLFHLIYSRYSEDVYDRSYNIVDSTTEFLPCGEIRQIHYEVAPWEVKYLYISSPYVVNESGKLLWRGFEDMTPHWRESDCVLESRTLLLQAEDLAECDKLIWFLKRAHFYPEMQLTYEAYNGVTLLAAPAPTLYYKALLDRVLAPFTSQF